MKKTSLIVTFVLIIVLSFIKVYEQRKEEKEGYVIKSQITTFPESDNSSSGDDNIPSEQATISTIRAYICGKVKKPQVYELPEGSRVIDFVNAAGGMTDDAASEYINLAGMVNDGDKIYIPSIDEVKETPSITGSSGEQGLSSSDTKVNINTADVDKIMTLPGIGESKARAIVKYRKEHGKFKDIKDILNVSGIGQSTFSNIEEFITVK